MTITFDSWIIPTVVTVVMLCIMFRPFRASVDYDFSLVFRAFWLIPILAVWVIYFGVILWIK